MLIKHFRSFGQRVPDPMRPGRTALVGRLRSSGGIDPISYEDPNGNEVEVQPDEDGWYDVPQDVGERLCRFRDKGSGFYERGQVDEEVRLGNVESAPPAPRAPAPKPKSSASPPAKNLLPEE